jgi:molecular chaperone GrpE
LTERRDPKYDDADVENIAEGDATEPSAQPSPQPAAAPAAEGVPLAEQIARLQAEKDELWQTLIRRQADFENARKRIERERHEGSRRAVARLLEELLPVLDAFERALAAHDDPAYEDYRKGFELIYKQLWEAAARQGLERIEAEGKPFDPHIHQAIERVETEEHPDGTVLEVLQPGYKLGDKLLRPAIVRVAVHPPAKGGGKASGAGSRVN